MYRVLFILPSFAGGGAERVLIGLANGMDRRRFQPTLIVLENHGPLAAELSDNISVISLDRRRLRQALSELRRIVLELEPAVVVSTMGYLNLGTIWSVGRYRSRFGLVVREANDPDVTIEALPFAALGRWLYRRYYRRASCIVAPSKAIGERLVSLVPSAKDKVQLLHNPVDESRIRNAAESPIRQSGSGKRFVAAGRLSYQKGFDRLLDWFSGLPGDFHLSILGEGPEGLNLEGKIEALNLDGKVVLTGFVANPWAYYAGADAFLLPSRWEGMPNAALEALACGTPVIAMSEAGAVQEIAEEAPVNSIRIANSDDEFINEIRNAVARDTEVLNASLLPHSFLPESVGQDFEKLIETAMVD